MTDYIKREDAIEIIASHDDTDGTIKVFSGRFVNGLISAIPPADVRENVRGEWIHDEITMNGNTVYTPNAKCSICDCYVFQESNFCPNCGAEMKR